MNSEYYDALAPYYKFLYPDWAQSSQRQAAALDGVIREVIGPYAHTILDAACGIGTQCLGLAELGYAVAASDISSGAVAIGRQEAQERGLQIDFDVADMRDLWQIHGKTFDVVLAGDNAVPHLLSEAEILIALRQFYQCTAAGGGCLLSVRDYDRLPKEGVQFYPRLIHSSNSQRLVIFDVWEFHGRLYDLTTFIVEDERKPTATTQVIRGARYYCVTLRTLEQLLKEAGYVDVQTLHDRLFQPLVIGRKAN